MILRILRLHVVPHSASLGLLVLRAWLGLSMIILHGWPKFMNFDTMVTQMADPFGIGPKATLILAIFSEVVCSALLVVGLFARLAALGGACAMLTAFFFVHKTALSGAHSGELAFIYLAGFVTLFISGPGRLAVDSLSANTGKN